MTEARQDPQTVFRDSFTRLVNESGLSIRDISIKARVPRSTLDGWKNGKGLPQNSGHLVNVIRVLRAAAGETGDDAQVERTWIARLRDAKDARDARSSRGSSSAPARGSDIAAERRERSIAATTAALQAFGDLRELGMKPDWRQERASYAGKDSPPLSPDEVAATEQWEQKRDSLLGKIQIAALDIDDRSLRTRITDAVRALQLWNGPMRHIRQSEGRTRYLVTTEAMEAIGAYRRGDPLPQNSADYKTTIEFVDLYLEEFEMNAGH